MLRPVQMSRVVVAGSNNVIEPVIEKLHELNLLHIVNYSGTEEEFEMGKPIGKSAEYSEQIIKLRSIERYLEITDKMPDRQFTESEILSQMDNVLDDVGADVIATAERIAQIENDVKVKQDQAAALKPLSGLPIPLELLRGYESLAVFVGTVVSPVEADVSKVSYVNEVFSTSSGGVNAVAVFVPVDKAGEVSGILAEHGFSEISTPEGLTGNVPSAISTLETEVKKLEAEKEPLQKKLNNVHVEMLDEGESNQMVETGEDIPTKIENPSLVRPYELITRLFAIPEYKEFDPSLLIFVFFPIMFGLILGDVAYGLIILIVMFMLKRQFKTPGWTSLINIVVISSIWAIIFGLVFGEIFGQLGLWDYIFSGAHHTGILGTVAHPHGVGTDFGSGFYGPLGRLGPEIGSFAGAVFPMYRLATASVLVLIGVSIFIGILHTGIGSILGIKTELAYGEKKHAYNERLPVLLFQVFFGLGLLGLIVGGLTHPLVLLSALVILISIVLLVMGPEGVMGVTHIPFYVSNLISYLRLLAIGLASVGVAFAANQLGLYVVPDLIGGSAGLAVGVVVLVIVHFINLLLGILSPFMHPLRLHYVEMFTKFYSQHGGGIEYTPFGYVRRFLKE
jgi:V/A-type H+-transporting ATPase subunit I